MFAWIQSDKKLDKLEIEDLAYVKIEGDLEVLRVLNVLKVVFGVTRSWENVKNFTSVHCCSFMYNQAALRDFMIF